MEQQLNLAQRIARILYDKKAQDILAIFCYAQYCHKSILSYWAN